MSDKPVMSLGEYYGMVMRQTQRAMLARQIASQSGDKAAKKQALDQLKAEGARELLEALSTYDIEKSRRNIRERQAVVEGITNEIMAEEERRAFRYGRVQVVGSSA